MRARCRDNRGVGDRKRDRGNVCGEISWTVKVCRDREKNTGQRRHVWEDLEAMRVNV